MAKAIELLVLLLLIALAAGGLVVGVIALLGRVPDPKQKLLTRWDRWEDTEEGPDECEYLVVYCRRENSMTGRTDLKRVDSVAWSDPDFEYKIEEVRNRASMRLEALNHSLPRGRDD